MQFLKEGARRGGNVDGDAGIDEQYFGEFVAGLAILAGKLGELRGFGVMAALAGAHRHRGQFLSQLVQVVRQRIDQCSHHFLRRAVLHQRHGTEHAPVDFQGERIRLIERRKRRTLSLNKRVVATSTVGLLAVVD